jgi:acid phosphatase family membrane protein YuiD
MLIAGETVLKGRLQPLAFVTYWSGCFILTAIAACVAMIDASRVRAEQRENQRKLIESTLQDIEREKRFRQAKKS